MPSQSTSTSSINIHASNSRPSRAFYTPPTCPPTPAMRVINLPFEEAGDANLLPHIMRGMPMAPPSRVAPAHASVPASTLPRTYPQAPINAASGVIVPALTSAYTVLSQQIASSSNYGRRQSSSPSRSTRHEGEGRRSSSRSSTLSSEGLQLASTLQGRTTTRRGSDDSMSSSNPSSKSSSRGSN